MEISLVGKKECSKSSAAETVSSELILKFAEATEQMNFDVLADLLAGHGEFEIQTSDLETLVVGKSEFLDWYRLKLSETEITTTN